MEPVRVQPAHQWPRPVRVGLVDDHPSVLAGVAGALRSTHDLNVVGTAGTVDAAVALAGQVDVLLCDMQLEGHAEGLEILARIHDGIAEARTPAVVILSGFDQPSLLRASRPRPGGAHPRGHGPCAHRSRRGRGASTRVSDWRRGRRIARPDGRIMRPARPSTDRLTAVGTRSPLDARSARP